MTAARVRVQGQWTVDDIDSLPTDLKRYELWNGSLIIMPAPTIRHQMIVKRWVKAFLAFDPDETQGELLFAPSDVVLSPEWVVQPDIMFVSNERREIIHAQRIYGGPDLVVEVLSPRTTEHDRTAKREAYASAHVLEYWLLDGDAEVVTVLVLQDGEYVEQGVYRVGDIARSTVLEGFAVDVGALFRDLPGE
jgi:Uma2 family endonuclease